MTYKTAEIIVVGSEFFTRSKIDTNSIWLTEQLEKRGIRVLAKRVVADNLHSLSSAFIDAMRGVDLVISTGGLGPTADDRTRDAFARACEVELEHIQEVEDDIAARFASRGRTMSENNRRQALIPAGAQVLPNANGTAPGFHLDFHNSTLLSLPGPPREMTALYDIFASRNETRFPSGEMIAVGRILRVTGLGESDMDRRICDLYQAVENPEVTVNFNADGLEIHLTARAENEAAAEVLLDPMVQAMEERLDGYLFSTDDSPLEAVVIRQLTEVGMKVALAESVTGGMVASKLASVPGASAALVGSLVTYTNEMKQEWLGVQGETLEQHTAVSEAVALEMVQGALQRSQADLALSCTGYAGPGGGTEADPVGTVYVGFATPEKTTVRRLSLPGERNLLRARIAQAMMYMMFRYLRKRAKAAV